MTNTTNPQAERRDRYAAAIREAEGWVLDGGQHMIDAVMAVADAEQAELRERHKAGLRRADEINNELMEEVQRYAEGKERPVLWSVYNVMHLRADNAEAEAERLRRLADVVPVSGPGGAADETQAETQAAAGTDTLPAWLRARFTASGVSWENLDADEQSYWEHQARAVRRAVARNGFKGSTAAPAAVSQPEPVPPVEHCIHDRTVHRTHHKQSPVTGCPWCTAATAAEDPTP